MYWTDWSMVKPHVGRANLNGSDVRILFTNPYVHWPNGITVDHIAEQIYWVDAKLDYIAAADLHGRNFRKIIQSGNAVCFYTLSISIYLPSCYFFLCPRSFFRKKKK